MPKLSDTQAIILAAAAERLDGCLLPLPGSLRGGAAAKVVGALLTRGLAAERISGRTTKADPAMNRIWRNLPEPDGRAVLLFITAAGAEAIGVEPETVPYAFNEGTNSAGEPAAGAAADAHMGADGAPVEAPTNRRSRPRKTAPTAPETGAAPKTRDGTKQAQLIAMLRRPEGATIAQIVDAVDVEPAVSIVADAHLQALVDRAADLAQRPDPKIKAVIDVLKPIIAGGANPVVFCRFIATADHVGAALRKAFPRLRLEVVTGALTPDERRARVEDMSEADQRILVATDCLSEGINLQGLFDSVIHYDLSWNPTRHQQREGRVDRFGQPAAKVRSVLLFSPDSAIDGAVLEVILRKAEAIRKATGVTVPLPDERGPVTDALLAAMLLRRGSHRQMSFDLRLEDGTRALEARWRDAEENEKKSRARFAQNAIKPEEVAPEWQRTRALLGGPAEVRRFLEHAMSRFDAPLEEKRKGFDAHIAHLPTVLKDRLAARGFDRTVRLVFDDPAPPGAFVATRNHPLTATLAESLVEGALDPEASPGATLGRTGAWPTTAVETRTVVLMLRLRFKLTVHGRRERLLLAEQAAFLAFGTGDAPIAKGDAVQGLLAAGATSDLAPTARDRLIAQARGRLEATLLDRAVAAFARDRATTLAEDHARLRATGAGTARVSVEAVLPADIIGLFVLLPEAD